MFKRLLNAGLTLRGVKCHIGMSTVHVFSAAGMSKKVQVVVQLQLVSQKYTMTIGTKKWKVCCADGPWLYRNTISK